MIKPIQDNSPAEDFCDEGNEPSGAITEKFLISSVWPSLEKREIFTVLGGVYKLVSKKYRAYHERTHSLQVNFVLCQCLIEWRGTKHVIYNEFN